MPVQAAPSSAVKSIKCPARLDATGGQRCSFQPQLRNRTVSAQCVAAIGVEITEGPHRHFVTPEGVEVFILGVEHCVKQPHLGTFILGKAPHSVVLETSLTQEHGSKTGNEIQLTEVVAGPEVFFFRMFVSMANALAKESDPASSKIWAQYQKQLFGEQIAYVAAFATGAKLIFGDRPKEVTYRRLLHMSSVEQLDRVFAQQSASNYADILTGQEPPADSDSVVERVMMLERDAVLCSSVHTAAQSAAGTGKCVVALVGAAHLPGMEAMWKEESWRDMVSPSSGDAAAWQSCLWDSPAEGAPLDQPDQLGVKRALLECVVRLRCTDKLVQDMIGILGPVPEDQKEAYESTSEIYSTCRMLLAVLEKDLLEQVVSGVGCDIYELLDGLRRVRPCNGGPGWDAALLAELRGLNFNLG